jgi:predicted PurR-regulated permease PerM
VGGFLKGQALVALSVGILSGLALYFLGLDYAVLLGFLICVFNIIPYLGPIVGGAPAVIIALGTSWQLAVVVAIVLVIIHEFDSIVISPRIMSQQVNLHPAVVIFALLTGGTLMGFVGMLVAIPIAAVGKALYLHFREREEEAAKASSEKHAKQGSSERDENDLRSAVKV